MSAAAASAKGDDDHDAFDEEEEGEDVSRRRRSRELARRILSKAPSLFSYRLDTIAATVQQWADFDLQRDDDDDDDDDGETHAASREMTAREEEY